MFSNFAKRMPILWLIYVVALFLAFFSIAHLSNVPMSQIGRAQWLADAGFDCFATMLKVLQPEQIVDNSEIIIPNEEFELIYNCLTGGGLNVSIHHLAVCIELADKYLANDAVMERIFELFSKCVNKSAEPFPILYIYSRASVLLKSHFLAESDFGISHTENEIRLDGWEISSNAKGLYLFFLSQFVSFFDSIIIRNLSLSETDLVHIQSMLRDNVTVLCLDNCSPIFNSNESFNFAHLTKLTHFQFSRCHFENFVSILKTVPRKNLLHLDISNNLFSKEEIDELMHLLREMPNLNSLNASFDLSCVWKRPKFTGELLLLSNLKSLNLSGNLDMQSLNNQLIYSSESNLEHLNISNNLHPFLNGSLFHKNLAHFKSLRTLNLSSTDYYILQCVYSKIPELKLLEEFTFNGNIDYSLVELLKILKDRFASQVELQFVSFGRFGS